MAATVQARATYGGVSGWVVVEAGRLRFDADDGITIGDAAVAELSGFRPLARGRGFEVRKDGATLTFRFAVPGTPDSPSRRRSRRRMISGERKVGVVDAVLALGDLSADWADRRRSADLAERFGRELAAAGTGDR